MIYISNPRALDKLPEHLCSYLGWADGFQSQGMVKLFADRIVDPTEHSGHVEDVLGDLGRHHISVVPLGNDNENIGFLNSCPSQGILISAVTNYSRALKVGRQTPEAIRVQVQYGDFVPFFGHDSGQSSSYSPTPHNENIHLCLPNVPLISFPGLFTFHILNNYG